MWCRSRRLATTMRKTHILIILTMFAFQAIGLAGLQVCVHASALPSCHTPAPATDDCCHPAPGQPATMHGACCDEDSHSQAPAMGAANQLLRAIEGADALAFEVVQLPAASQIVWQPQTDRLSIPERPAYDSPLLRAPPTS